MHENRETSTMPESEYGIGRTVKVSSRKTVTPVVEEWDLGTVPMNHPNKVGHHTTAEAGEGSPGAKENSPTFYLPLTQSGICRSQGLLGVRPVARRKPNIRFTALLHHVTVPFLRDCFCRLKRQAAPGVEGMRWKEYEQQLETDGYHYHRPIQSFKCVFSATIFFGNGEHADDRAMIDWARFHFFDQIKLWFDAKEPYAPVQAAQTEM